MASWRSCLALALCALLGLTGHAMAFARGQAPAAGQVVICFGHLSKTIHVDAQGQPTSPPELCADCLNPLMATEPRAMQIARPLGLVPAPGTTAVHVFKPGSLPGTQSARGPPSV